MCPRGEIGRHKGLKILALWECQFESGRGTTLKMNKLKIISDINSKSLKIKKLLSYSKKLKLKELI